MSRLMTLMARSPSWPPMPTIKPVKISSVVVKWGKEKPQDPRHDHGKGRRADRAAPRFSGADVAAQGLSSKELSAGERGHVVQFRGDHDEEQVAVRMIAVGEEAEMAEHPSHVDEAEDGEGEFLQLPAKRCEGQG